MKKIKNILHSSTLSTSHFKQNWRHPYVFEFFFIMSLLFRIHNKTIECKNYIYIYIYMMRVISGIRIFYSSSYVKILYDNNTL